MGGSGRDQVALSSRMQGELARGAITLAPGEAALLVGTLMGWYAEMPYGAHEADGRLAVEPRHGQGRALVTSERLVWFARRPWWLLFSTLYWGRPLNRTIVFDLATLIDTKVEKTLLNDTIVLEFQNAQYRGSVNPSILSFLGSRKRTYRLWADTISDAADALRGTLP